MNEKPVIHIHRFISMTNSLRDGVCKCGKTYQEFENEVMDSLNNYDKKRGRNAST